MKLLYFTLVNLPILITGVLLAQTELTFDKFFINKTMRLDYFHTGTHDQESYSYDEIFQEPVWAGSKINLIDTLNLGKYLFKVYDTETNEIIYSRGFCSIFGEWRTTEEAKKNIRRTFSESIRFPYPQKSIRITIGKHGQQNIFQENWSFTINPNQPNIRKTSYFKDTRVLKLMHNGDQHTKLDLVILPDGYTKNKMKKFHKDAERLLSVLFEIAPFKERKKDFNVRALEVPSRESGIDNPRTDKYVDNIFSCSYNAFGTDRYVLTYDNKTVRKAASQVPYDRICILINSSKYGGGGIYNLYANCAVDNKWSGYIFVHEIGHSLAGLADEYYTSDVAYIDFYPQGIEPWEPNVTAQINKNDIKWHNLIEPETPVPTPWDKEEFDKHQAEYLKERKKLTAELAPELKIDSMSTVNTQWVHDFLKCQKYFGKVGAFEGGCYTPKGLFRPFIDCIMFTRNMTGFDPVCRRTIENVIDFYTR